MLTLTDSATTVVKTITDQTPESDTAGLRISAEEIGSSELSLAVTPQPEPLDTVIENSGAKVYLEEKAAVVLDDKVLDAEISEDGSVKFSIGAQA